VQDTGADVTVVRCAWFMQNLSEDYLVGPILRAIHYVAISVEEYAAAAAEHGVPAEFVGFLSYLFSEVLGRNAYLTDGVQRALGRRPRDFAEYARDTAATGVWAAPAPDRVS
jgi:hypothetical protein